MTHNNTNFENILGTTPKFKLRQAVERLREGLFDPLGVRLLTTGETTLKQHFETQTQNLEKGKPAHLCVCGAYGQGKSHTLNYIRQRALKENYVVSSINLDPREVPFHNIKQVYRSIMENLTFPDNNIASSDGSEIIRVNSDNTEFVDIWKKSVKHWLSIPANHAKPLLNSAESESRAEEAKSVVSKSVVDMIPENIPHRFKAILTAMAQQTESIPNGKRNLKKYAGFKPREFPWILLNAFMGKEIPVTQLRNALKYRQVSFYNDESLACRAPLLYLEAIKGYSALFQNMGYIGFVVLFDEAESIMVATIKNRSKSYSILHEIFCPKIPAKGFFPVFAFTDDFFTHLGDEDFERKQGTTKSKSVHIPLTENDKDAIPEIKELSGGSQEVSVFERNYSNAWKDINIYKLRNLTSKEWHDIIRKLIDIHALAYNWKPDVGTMDKIIFSRLLKQSDSESRIKLKLIVNILDIEQQQMLISKYS